MVWIIAIAALLAVLAAYDILQRRHTILRIFPIIGHMRYLIESIGPELRQYIITSNDEERPFSRDERRWIYASAKQQNNFFSFGTDNDLDRSPNHVIIRHVAFPLATPQAGLPGAEPRFEIPCAKVFGERHGRAHAFRPASIVNISGMSYGALGRNAVEALNRGAKLAGVLQTTGEGGISPYHLNGGDLVFQFGTGYFGARGEDGAFSLDQLEQTVALGPVRAIEIKLSQGAKPGHGAILPASKVSREIARIRNVPLGEDCISPPEHTAFSNVDELIEFIERIAERTGLPVGIKSAVGHGTFWSELAARMASTGGGPDFITIDGGEGGTGAAPLVHTDHVSLPFALGMAQAYGAFAKQGIAEEVAFVGSGRLGLPERALLAFALGCDAVNVAREAMFSIGCIQSMRCHTGHCPTGVTTHSPWRQRGLVPSVKAERAASYVLRLRDELAQLARTCGVHHPAQVSPDHLTLLSGWEQQITAHACFGYEPGWGIPTPEDMQRIEQIMRMPVSEVVSGVWAEAAAPV